MKRKSNKPRKFSSSDSTCSSASSTEQSSQPERLSSAIKVYQKKKSTSALSQPAKQQTSFQSSAYFNEERCLIDNSVSITGLEDVILRKKAVENRSFGQIFGGKGGNNPYDCLKRCLNNNVKDEILVFYSFYGRRKNKSFKKLSTWRALVRAIQNQLNVTEENLEKSMSSCLRHPKERLQKEK
ncbi:hypothetical protein FQR65_LT00001 [Abscondita terminalis]|nr:hypothetical protein FQR65_LT00001 [Abscondita terminalis]